MISCVKLQIVCAVLLCGLSGGAESQAVVAGIGIDYMPSVQRDQQDGSLVMVFERLDPGTFFGDLYATRSADDGETWSNPQLIIGSSANERHPSLVQMADGQWRLYYLQGSGSTTSYRIAQATSTDGSVFLQTGALDLGWASGGEVNPHVVQQADRLTMVYQRLSGGIYLAQSTDSGISWDTQRRLISSDGLLPRVAYRTQDSRLFVSYQTNPGSNQLRLHLKQSTDPGDWTSPAIMLASDGDNHDSLPWLTEEGGLVVFFSRARGSQYDLASRFAPDGLNFESIRWQSQSADRSDVQAHPVSVTGERDWVQLYWGVESPPGSLAFDVHRMTRTAISHAIFSNGAEQ